MRIMLTITRFKHSCLSTYVSMLTFVCALLKDGNNEYTLHTLYTLFEVYTMNGFLEFQQKCVENAVSFYTTCLLPEILGNWYTRPTSRNNADAKLGPSESGVDTACNDMPSAAQENQTFCFFYGPEEGDHM